MSILGSVAVFFAAALVCEAAKPTATLTTPVRSKGLEVLLGTILSNNGSTYEINYGPPEKKDEEWRFPMYIPRPDSQTVYNHIALGLLGDLIGFRRSLVGLTNEQISGDFTPGSRFEKVEPHEKQPVTSIRQALRELLAMVVDKCGFDNRLNIWFVNEQVNPENQFFYGSRKNINWKTLVISYTSNSYGMHPVPRSILKSTKFEERVHQRLREQNVNINLQFSDTMNGYDESKIVVCRPFHSTHAILSKSQDQVVTLVNIWMDKKHKAQEELGKTVTPVTSARVVMAVRVKHHYASKKENYELVLFFKPLISH